MGWPAIRSKCFESLIGIGLRMPVARFYYFKLVVDAPLQASSVSFVTKWAFSCVFFFCVGVVGVRSPRLSPAEMLWLMTVPVRDVGGA
jgi:hypothetical protein